MSLSPMPTVGAPVILTLETTTDFRVSGMLCRNQDERENLVDLRVLGPRFRIDAIEIHWLPTRRVQLAYMK